MNTMYRVAHLLANLGCVDFDFGCSTFCLVLPGLMGLWQKWLSSWARWWNISNQSQPNPGSPRRLATLFVRFHSDLPAKCALSRPPTR